MRSTKIVDRPSGVIPWSVTSGLTAKWSNQFWSLGLKRRVNLFVNGSMAANVAPLYKLQEAQAKHRLSLACSPPCLRGIMWSM